MLVRDVMAEYFAAHVANYPQVEGRIVAQPTTESE